MRPTQVLSNEHRVIEVVINCLEALVVQTKASERLDAYTAEQIVDFIRTFADGCHHGKEENYLFTALESKGASRESGPVGVMLNEHDLGRGYVAQMKENINGAAAGKRLELQMFSTASMCYVQLLRSHIQKEDQILFPLADQLLSSDDFDKMTSDFANVESHHMGEGTHQKYLDLAASLAAKLGVNADALKAHTGCGCGHKKNNQASVERHAV